MLSYNTLSFTKLALLSIKAFEPKIPYELVVLDQGSKDGSHEWLSQIKWKNFKYERLEGNYLFSRGNNILRQIVDPASKYLLLLNSDVEAHKEGWLEERIQPMINDPKIGVTGTAGNCHNYLTGGKFFLDDLLASTQIDEEKKIIEKQFKEKCVLSDNIIREITGWSLGTTAALWDRLGGLAISDKYKHMWSDSEYCIRAQMRGYKLALQPYNDKMTHYSGISYAAIHNPKNYDERVQKILTNLAKYESTIKLNDTQSSI